MIGSLYSETPTKGKPMFTSIDNQQATGDRREAGMVEWFGEGWATREDETDEAREAGPDMDAETDSAFWEFQWGPYFGKDR